MRSDTGAKNHAIFFMVACSALWSIAGIFIKMVPWHPLVIAGVRSLIASGVLFIYMRAVKLRFRLNRSSIISGVMLSLTFFAFVSANKLTTSANAIVLQYASPVFVMMISALLYGQRFRKADYIVVAATIFGIALCFISQMSSGSLPGNIIAVLSGFTMASMFVASGNADADSRMSGIFIGHIITAVIGLPFIFVFPTIVSSKALASIFILGIVQLGIPYLLYGIAARHCSPLVCCLVGALEPLLNPIWVFIFDGEAPGIFSMIGGVWVISVITLWCIYNARHSPAA